MKFLLAITFLLLTAIPSQAIMAVEMPIFTPLEIKYLSEALDTKPRQGVEYEFTKDSLIFINGKQFQVGEVPTGDYKIISLIVNNAERTIIRVELLKKE
jgi:hypothetical protein